MNKLLKMDYFLQVVMFSVDIASPGQQQAAANSDDAAKHDGKSKINFE
jgi:hypothetical protein